MAPRTPTTEAPPWRPTKLTADLETRVCTVLGASANATLACQAVRIDRRTYYNWLKRGQQDLLELAATQGVEPGDIDLESLTFDDHPHVHFLHATTKALGDYELQNIAIVQRAARGTTSTTKKSKTTTYRDGTTVTVEEETTSETRHWQAAAWLLERRFPESYARISRHELTGAGGGPIDVVDPAVQRQKAEDVIAEVAGRLSRDEVDLTAGGD